MFDSATHVFHKATPHASAWILGGLFALCTFFGREITTFGTLGFLQPNLSNVAAAFIFLALPWVIYAYGIELVFKLIHWRCNTPHLQPKIRTLGTSEYFNVKTAQSGHAHLASLKMLLAFQGVLVLAWSPYLVAGLPGNISYDVTWQLSMGEGLIDFTTHHPPFTTILYTTLFEAAYAIGGIEAAGLALSCFQVCLFSIVFAYSLLWMKRLKAPRGLIVFSLLFWAFIPVFPSFAQMIMKDSLACAALVFFILQIIIRLQSLLQNTEIPQVANAPALVIACVLCCLTRNESIAIVIPSLLALALLEHRRRWNSVSVMSSTALCVMGIWLLFNLAVFPALNITQGNSREALSIPMQQTARYLRDFPNEITDEERNILEQATSISLDDFGAAYNPNNCDYIKDRFDTSALEGGTTSYLLTWLSMGLRHPGTYIAAALESTLGYWYPFTTTAMQDYTPERGNPTVVDSTYLITQGLSETWLARFGSFGTAWADSLFAFINKAVYYISDLPILRLLSVPATYVWASMCLCTFMFTRKNPGWILCIPLFIKLLTCMASPLSGSMRYALPIAASIPLLILACFALSRHKHKAAYPAA